MSVLKIKKDAREEFKTVKKNVKSEALKLIVKDLEQAIFGYGDDEGKEELEETEELNRKFKNLISKKRLGSFKELEKAKEVNRKFKNLISKKRLEPFKEYLKKADYIDPQSRVNALRKKLNNLPKTSSDETSDENSDKASDETSDDNNDNNDNNDSEDNQISNFVDRLLKKASKEIVNDDNKDDDSKNDDSKKLLKLSKENGDLKKKLNISLKANKKAEKNISKQLKKIDKIKQKEEIKASKNLLNKQVSDAKKILKLIKKDSELNAKAMAETDESIKEILAKSKDRAARKIDEKLREYNTKKAQRASKEIEKFNKMINDNLDMSSEKSEIVNRLIELCSLRKLYYLNNADNNSKANEKIHDVSIDREISKLEKRHRDVPKKGSGVFASQKEFAKLLTFLAQLHAGNNSKKFKNNINQLLKALYSSKQISELVYKKNNRSYLT